MFTSTLRWWNLETQQLQLLVILDLYCRKTQAGEYHNYREFSKNFVFKMLSLFQRVFEKLHFRDGLLWTVGLTVELKLRFRDGLVWANRRNKASFSRRIRVDGRNKAPFS